MAVVSYNALLIGRLPDMDPYEDSYNGENMHYTLNGRTFGASGDPLYSKSTRVSLIDRDGDGGIDHNQNNYAGDYIRYDEGGVQRSFELDTGGVINNVYITQALPGGGTRSFYATVRIMQDTYGNTFILPPKADGSDSTEGDVAEYPLISARFPTYEGNYNTNYSTASTDRTNLTSFQDGYVDGTDAGETIDTSYTGDPDGDRVDNNDPWLPGAVGDDDYIRAYGGNDTVYAGAGRDVVEGGEGDDVIYGYGRYSDDGASDTLRGGAGHDKLYGGGGDDHLDGGTGNDTLDGGEGNDSLTGGEGNDTLYGGHGDDTLDGGAGNDSMHGGSDNDLMYGGAGDDTLYGEGGQDTLDGGAGNDLLHGGYGADTLTGGEGFDTFVVTSGDKITDFNTGSGQDFADKDQGNNDFVDLSQYYNKANLAIWNANNPGRTFKDPLEWLRADQADGGTLNMLDGQNGLPTFNLTINNGGSAVAAGDLTWDNTNVCFADDTLIETDKGARVIADLKIGDRVMTRDNGLQAIRWIGFSHISAAHLAAVPSLRPVRIRAGALGQGLPEADLVVSPQHRILVRSKIAQKMFGTDEVLVAAKQLMLLAGIGLAYDLDSVTYVHMLFDRHEVVISNGAETESLFTGPEALKAVGPAARAEILALFPELVRPEAVTPAARVLASGRMGRKLAMRHGQNGKALLGRV